MWIIESQIRVHKSNNIFYSRPILLIKFHSSIRNKDVLGKCLDSIFPSFWLFVNSSFTQLLWEQFTIMCGSRPTTIRWILWRYRFRYWYWQWCSLRYSYITRIFLLFFSCYHTVFILFFFCHFYTDYWQKIAKLCDRIKWLVNVLCISLYTKYQM